MHGRLAVAAGGLQVGLLGAAVAVRAAGFNWSEDPAAGTLTLLDGSRPVYTYVWRVQQPEGVPAPYRNACYLHPVYDLEGQPLTSAYPEDHFHHRGVWLSWPRMKVGDREAQLWHPSPLRQRFGGWEAREADAVHAVLSVKHQWVLEDEVVAVVDLTIETGEADAVSRAVDVTWRLEAVREPIQVLGAVDKGYGGMSVRLGPSFRGGTMTTNEGVLDQDAVDRRFRWADLSDGSRGVAVFVPSDHPSAPVPWLVRNSYDGGGILNPSWPGLEAETLAPGRPVTLAYRIYVHRGGAEAGRVAHAYRAYADGRE